MNRAEASRSADDIAALDRIVGVVRAGFGVDFTEYKAETFGRRVASRMKSTGVGALLDYVELLLADPYEVGRLYEDLLTHVTCFFRDPEVFETLANETIPAILARKQAHSPVRVWVAGCATGEEAYSLAILLLESLGDAAQRVQVYGTDVSHAVITTARMAVYPDDALAFMSQARREKYFVQLPIGWRVKKSVRDLCSFFQQDVAQDPPLSGIDLVSCRNVVMYFRERAQKRLLATFHYALEQPGFLLLGCAEYIWDSDHLFAAADKTNKVFARKPVASAGRFDRTFEARPSERHRDPFAAPTRPPGIARYLDRVLLTRYVPPGVLINESMEILEYRGKTGPFLELAPGNPSNNIMTMVRRGLRAPLLAAIDRAKDESTPVRMRGVQVQQDGATLVCDLVVVPLMGVPEARERLYVVMFETATPRSAPARPSAARPRGRRSTPPPRNADAEHAATKEVMRRLIDEHDRTVIALRDANRDLTSRNDELQRMNDDLLREKAN